MLMASHRDTWYYMVSANFYTNHVGEDFVGRANQKAAQQSVSAMKGVRGRQGAQGAKTTRSTMVYSPTKEAIKILLNAELQAKKATFDRAAKDGDGFLAGHFTTTARYSIVTTELSGAEECVEAQFEYGVAKFPDGRYRITHFAGVHV